METALNSDHPSAVSAALLRVRWPGPLLLIMGTFALIAAVATAAAPLAFAPPGLLFTIAIALIIAGALLVFAHRSLGREAGIDNDRIFQSGLTARGMIAWLEALGLTGFYLAIYFGRRIQLGEQTLHQILDGAFYSLFNPLAIALRGKAADEWFVYSTLYTFAVLLFGVRMLWKYRHIRYQVLRTVSVMAFQLALAFLVPNLLKLFQQPEFYFSYFWPLKPEYLYPATWANLARDGVAAPGAWFLGFGALMSFVATPLLTMRYGKRWYCSWVCGCGGLAETMGDPFRQLSDKSLRAWRIERWMIHGVLVAIVIVTAVLWTNSLGGGRLLGAFSQPMADAYGLYIGMLFAGVAGVGFYPLLGSRVWCRFGCPMAAILGLFQKKASQFRISTNGGQCISCGNCSTYCEMGIDVRWYAQRGQNIVRSSCVGCGICSAVCPRGVLRLESGPISGRDNSPAPFVLH